MEKMNITQSITLPRSLRDAVVATFTTESGKVTDMNKLVRKLLQEYLDGHKSGASPP
jgi:hypothetical protein